MILSIQAQEDELQSNKSIHLPELLPQWLPPCLGEHQASVQTNKIFLLP